MTDDGGEHGFPKPHEGAGNERREDAGDDPGKRDLVRKNLHVPVDERQHDERAEEGQKKGQERCHAEAKCEDGKADSVQ